MNFDYQRVGTDFVQQYYLCFDQQETRPHIIPVYSPEALLTFEGEQCRGTEAVKKRLLEKFQIGSIKRNITKFDCQPLLPDSVIVYVFGQLGDSDSTDKMMGFSQVFILKAIGQSFVITNEIFRLTLHDFAA